MFQCETLNKDFFYCTRNAIQVVTRETTEAISLYNFQDVLKVYQAVPFHYLHILQMAGYLQLS